MRTNVQQILALSTGSDLQSPDDQQLPADMASRVVGDVKGTALVAKDNTVSFRYRLLVAASIVCRNLDTLRLPQHPTVSQDQQSFLDSTLAMNCAIVYGNLLRFHLCPSPHPALKKVTEQSLSTAIRMPLANQVDADVSVDELRAYRRWLGQVKDGHCRPRKFV